MIRQTYYADTVEVFSMWSLRRSRTVAEPIATSQAAGRTPAAPDLSPDDIELIHRLWLELTEALPRAELHHSDVVTLALQHLRRQFDGPESTCILDAVRRTQAHQSRVRTYSEMPGVRTTETRINTPMLKPLNGGRGHAGGIRAHAPSLERRADRRRHDQIVSLWGTALSFSIPIVLLIGVIWNPAGAKGDAVMASLAALVLARLGIALVKRGAIGRREQPWPTDTASGHAATWKSEESLQSQHAR
jgi:hypothetical protein